MRLIRIVVALAIATLVPLLSATAAHAELTGPCTGTGQINAAGEVYNPKVQDSIVIPRAGEVHWRGTVPGAGKRAIDGAVKVKLPWPFKEITLNGDWKKSSAKHANAGIYTYDLPSVLVGPKFTLFGRHREPGVVCTGTIDVRISGSKWKNPALIASLLFTVLAVINLSVVIRVRGRAI
jgi:hypothetical protein